MKNILVPIGSSDNSANTLQYAIDFAAAFDCKILAMQAYNVKTPAGMMANVDKVAARSSKERIQQVVEKVDKKGVNVKIVTSKGELLDGIKAVDKELGIDLIVLEPRSNDIREEVFLGNTSGSIVKQTDIPALIVPRGNTFISFETALTAFKSGVLKSKKKLKPLMQLQEKFGTKVNLLLVKTPDYKKEDLTIDSALMDISSNVTITENATTFQGVLEHFRENHPDILCVFRRKRGFFVKLWEKNIILKREFHCTIPLLVMSAKKD